MVRTMQLRLFLLPVILFSCLVTQAAERCDGDLPQLLRRLEDGTQKTKNEALACLLRTGELRTAELVRLLDDNDKQISLLAQLSLRYIGDEVGMRELHQWYGRQTGSFPVIGPTPVPLLDWDYRFIEANMLNTPPDKWESRGVSYIYALGLDGSEHSQKLLKELKVKAQPLAVRQGSTLYAAIRHTERIKPCGSSDDGNFLKIAKVYAFFIEPDEWKHTTVNMIGTDSDGSKVLVEFYTSYGPLAEEVAAAEPLLTTTNAKGEVEGVKYDRVAVVLVNAVKEQQTQIETQQKQIEQQQAEIEQLKKKAAEINELKALVCGLSPDAQICKKPN